MIALDVGHGQLHPKLRGDERVTVIERTNVRDATTETIGGLVDAVVADVSFISLTVIIPVLVSLCQPGSPMVLLVKPQFEAGRAEVGRGRGVITDPAIHDRVRPTIADSLDAAGCAVVGWMDSPILGGEGNREFLVHARSAAGHRRDGRRDRRPPRARRRRHARPLDRRTGWSIAATRRGSWPEDAAAARTSPTSPPSEPVSEADLVVSVGGDGTMLRAVRVLDGAPVPLLGVNVGVLGYLTEIEPPQVTEALERFVAGSDAGSWHLDERMMLEVTRRRLGVGRLAGAQRGGRREARVGSHRAPAGAHRRRAVHELRRRRADRRHPDRFDRLLAVGARAGGLAAPPGPAADPVSPHMLFDRTLVLDPTERVEIEVDGFRPAELAVDGQLVATLTDGDIVTCCTAEATACFVRLAPHHFHQILKRKFGLADR